MERFSKADDDDAEGAVAVATPAGSRKGFDEGSSMRRSISSFRLWTGFIRDELDVGSVDDSESRVRLGEIIDCTSWSILP